MEKSAKIYNIYTWANDDHFSLTFPSHKPSPSKSLTEFQIVFEKTFLALERRFCEKTLPKIKLFAAKIAF